MSTLAEQVVNALKTDFDEVYQAGVEKGKAQGGNSYYDEFWDNFQDKGNRNHYNNAFMGVGWRKETLKPKYDIVPLEANAMFQDGWITQNHITENEMINMADVERECGIVFDFSQCTKMSNTFRQTIFKSLNKIDLKSAKSSLTYTFYGTASQVVQTYYKIGLKRIERLICYEDNVFATTTFQGCYILEYVGFEGVIARSVDLQWSSLLVDESVQKLIDCLKDLTGLDSQTITFHADVKAKLTEDQKATISAKNWVLG